LAHLEGVGAEQVAGAQQLEVVAVRVARQLLRLVAAGRVVAVYVQRAVLEQLFALGVVLRCGGGVG
jgi:hypothetical protein